MESYIVDWLNLLIRWLHLITGVAWIGASIYFVMLDNSLSAPRKVEDAQRGVSGELWAVHGGGFYNSQKFLTGPKGEPLPEDLHWSKWEAYTTWLSGMALMAIIYWYGASVYLVDPSVMALSPAAAVGTSLAFLAGGWIVYDLLCRTLGANENVLAGIVLLLVMAASWALFQVFSPRGAYIHVGAMIGTMMVANVFFHIIPGQKRMVQDIRAGREPDPTPGIIGKQRSVHNTYFTLPVLFIMISNHYPMTYSHKHGWAVLGVIMLAGVLIRQFFVLRHRGKETLWLPGIAIALLAGLAVAMAPRTDAGKQGEKVSFAKVQGVFKERCVSCHSANPTQPGFSQPPKGVLLETADQIAANAPKVAETVASRYMPIGNLTQMTDEERALVAAWFSGGGPTK
jgi:uncharacterized membrane protein